MRSLTFTCPNCQTVNEIARDAVFIECGLVSCTYTCISCRVESLYEEPYWRWLGLEEEPPAESART